ncbi:hypothetical protein Tco_0006934 [Tanacetum coccineum]
MDIFTFIHTSDPTKVNVVERERKEDKPSLLETTIGRTVPLLPVALDRAESELEVSVDKLFDEVGSGDQSEQGGSAHSGRGVEIQLKRKAVVADTSGASHPPKKLREDHGTPSGTSVGGKSWSSLQRLLAGAVLNVEVEFEAIPTLPFVTASVSTTSEREGANVTEAEVDSLVRSSVLVMTTATTITPTVDLTSVAKEKPIKPSPLFASSSSAGGTDATMGGFSNLTGSDFLVGGIRTMVDEFAPPKFFASVRGMEHDQLFTKFNVGAARKMSLSVKVRMRVEYNIKERMREAEAEGAICLRTEASNFGAIKKSLQDETNALREHNVILKKERNALDVKVTELEASAVSKERELVDLNAQLTFVKSQNDNLVDQVHELEMALHLEEKFYPHLLTTISGHRWLLTQGMELAITKCLNSPEYLVALGAAIGMAIEKGMQDGLSARITHGKEGRVLTDVAAYNPFVEVDYIFALQQLQNVNFPLLAELRSNTDASIEAVMNILRLKEPLADKLGLGELQPHVDQLMVSIRHSPDKVIIGATALSLALDVSSILVQKIKENIANQRSVLHDVFVLLSEPLSTSVLTGTEGTSDTVPATVDTTMALSTTFASASIITPISVDDYEVVGTDDQADADGNVEPFPNVDDVELNIP